MRHSLGSCVGRSFRSFVLSWSWCSCFASGTATTGRNLGTALVALGLTTALTAAASLSFATTRSGSSFTTTRGSFFATARSWSFAALGLAALVATWLTALLGFFAALVATVEQTSFSLARARNGEHCYQQHHGGSPNHCTIHLEISHSVKQVCKGNGKGSEPKTRFDTSFTVEIPNPNTTTVDSGWVDAPIFFCLAFLPHLRPNCQTGYLRKITLGSPSASNLGDQTNAPSQSVKCADYETWRESEELERWGYYFRQKKI